MVPPPTLSRKEHSIQHPWLIVEALQINMDLRLLSCEILIQLKMLLFRLWFLGK